MPLGYHVSQIIFLLGSNVAAHFVGDLDVMETMEITPAVLIPTRNMKYNTPGKISGNKRPYTIDGMSNFIAVKLPIKPQLYYSKFHKM